MSFAKAPRIAVITVIFTKALVIQKTHNTFHAADYLRRRGVSLMAALKLLTRRKNHDMLPSTNQTAHLVRPKVLACNHTTGN